MPAMGSGFGGAPIELERDPGDRLELGLYPRIRLTREIFGDAVVWVPWRRPGFQLGLDIAVDASEGDWTAKVREATRHRGVDAILDLVGGAYLNGNLRFDEGAESRGTLNLVAAVEGPAGGEGADMRALVYADADLFSDPVLSSLAPNAAIVADGVRWLGREEAFSGEIESEADVPIVHTRAENVVWFYAVILGAPVLVLAVGLWVGLAAARRRRARGMTAGRAAAPANDPAPPAARTDSRTGRTAHTGNGSSLRPGLDDQLHPPVRWQPFDDGRLHVGAQLVVRDHWQRLVVEPAEPELARRQNQVDLVDEVARERLVRQPLERRLKRGEVTHEPVP